MILQSLHQMHRDIVYTTPKGVENLGHSQHCEVQGLYQQGRVFSVQAHPEFDEFITSEIVHRRHDQGIFDDSLFQDGLSRASLKHDGGIVAGAMVQFLLGV
jgi:GMP synthase-like glutamine amidotransferase